MIFGLGMKHIVTIGLTEHFQVEKKPLGTLCQLRELGILMIN